MNLYFRVCLMLTGFFVTGLAHAQDLTATLADGSYHVLGGETVHASASVPEGFEPLPAPVPDELPNVFSMADDDDLPALPRPGAKTEL